MNISDDLSEKIILLGAGGIITLILTKVLPFLWKSFAWLMTWIGAKLGGRFSHQAFQKRYLDWMVTEWRELKLTGIVSHDDNKKPRLEQVFLSLQLDSQRDDSNEAREATAAQSAIKSCNDLFEILYFKKRHEKSPAKKQQLKVLLSNVKSLQKALKSDVPKGMESTVAEERLIQEFIQRNGDEFDNSVANLNLRRTLNTQAHIAILGVPGAGKSTLLQHIALTLAKEHAGDPKLRKRETAKLLGYSEWKVPILVRLSNIAHHLAKRDANGLLPSILDILPLTLPPDLQKDPASTQYFRWQLRRGRCLFLFDGLDEVPSEEEFQAVVTAIRSLIATNENNQYLVTSRIAGWRGGIGIDFNTYYVSDLSNRHISTFIDSWYEAVERNAIVGRTQDEGSSERALRERRAEQQASNLKTALKNDAGIRRIATNPMLLSIIALVHRSLATLPKERSKLYAQCSKIFLEQWDISRGIRVDDTNLKLEQKEAILRRLAFALHTGEIGDKDGGREADRKSVEALLRDLLPSLGRAAEDSHRLLTMLIERSGIIIERQRDILSFSHHTFQEYFTAQYLATNSSIDQDFLLGESRLITDWWREVILLYSGLISDSSELISTIHAAKTTDISSSSLRLAALCLAESVKVERTDIRARLLEDVKTLRSPVHGKKISITAQTGEYLTRWAKTRNWITLAANNYVAYSLQTQPEGPQNLLQILRQDNSTAQISALNALITCLSSNTLVSNELITELSNLTKHQETEVRNKAAHALTALAGYGFVDAVISCLQSSWSSTDFLIGHKISRSLIVLVDSLGTPNSLCLLLKGFLTSIKDENPMILHLFGICSASLRQALFSDEYTSRILKDGTTQVEIARRAETISLLDSATILRLDLVQYLDTLLSKKENYIQEYATRTLSEISKYQELNSSVDDIVKKLLSSHDDNKICLGLSIIAQSNATATFSKYLPHIKQAIASSRTSLRTAGCEAIGSLMQSIDDEDAIFPLIFGRAAKGRHSVRIAALAAVGKITSASLRLKSVNIALNQVDDDSIIVRMVAARSIYSNIKLGLRPMDAEGVSLSLEVALKRQFDSDPMGGLHTCSMLLLSSLLVLGIRVSSIQIFDKCIDLWRRFDSLMPHEESRNEFYDVGENRYVYLSAGRLEEIGFSSWTREEYRPSHEISFAVESVLGGFPSIENLITRYSSALPFDLIEKRFLRFATHTDPHFKKVSLSLLASFSGKLSTPAINTVTNLILGKDIGITNNTLLLISKKFSLDVPPEWESAITECLCHSEFSVQEYAWRALERIGEPVLNRKEVLDLDRIGEDSFSPN
jgi:energy-coupling factor transporter ATP-binding protein EcfA2